MKRTLIYDSDCGFCTRSAEWLARTGSCHIEPWQGVRDLAGLGLTEKMVMTASYWVDDGQVTASAEASIANALIARGGYWRFAGRFILVPGVRQLAAPVYKLIAKNRHAMPGGTNACQIPQKYHHG